MTAIRPPLVVWIIVACIIFVAGCVSQPSAENQTVNETGNITEIISPEITVSNLCPPQENTTPWIIINPISDHSIGDYFIGDVFVISGTTNFGMNDTISYWISRVPIRVRHPSKEYTIKGFVRPKNVECNLNTWSFSVNTSELGGGYYDVLVGNENMTISDWKVFYLADNLTKRA